MTEMPEHDGRDPNAILRAYARGAAELLAQIEDNDDTFDAERAMLDDGESVPLSELEAEFGLV